MGEEGWKLARKVYSMDREELEKTFGKDEIGDVLMMPYDAAKRMMEESEERKFAGVTTETLTDIVRILERTIKKRREK